MTGDAARHRPRARRRHRQAHRRLVELGHDVLATDPSRRCWPSSASDQPGRPESSHRPRTSRCATASVDTVVCGAVVPLVRPRPGAARDRPGAQARRPLALVWNELDERIPWVRRLRRCIGTQDQRRGPDRGARAARRCSASSRRRRSGSGSRSTGSRSGDLVLSRSYVAEIDEDGAARSSPRSPRSTTTTAAARTACCSPT